MKLVLAPGRAARRRRQANGTDRSYFLPQTGAAYLTGIVPREFGRTSRIGADESDEKSEFTIHVVAGGIKTFAQHWPGHLRERRQISLRVDGTEDASYSRQVSRLNWSRREDLNTPSADYKSAALALSYTGEKS